VTEFSLVLKATLFLYWDSIRAACRALYKNWLIVPAGVAAFIAYVVLASLVSNLGILGGFILGFASCALISIYYNWLAAAADNDRLSYRDLLQFDYFSFSAVISVAFVIWIAKFLVSSVAVTPEASIAPLFLNLAIVVALNALPEVVYLLRLEGMSALARAFVFTRDNWIEWFLPFVLIALPGLLVSPLQVLLIASSAEPMLPVSIIIATSMQGLPTANSIVGWILSILIAVVVANWYMLFRAFLFKELESGSRRRRVYKMKQQL
jgi:hypothetical protein